jgi:hypothetical protein
MIPAVKVYPSSEPTARETVLEARAAARGRYSITYELRHRSAGVEARFRAHRFDSESWGVVFDCPSSGTRNGRWYLTESEARRMFDLWTAEG